DLDDFGAEVGQVHRAIGASTVLFDGKDAQSLQGKVFHVWPLFCKKHRGWLRTAVKGCRLPSPEGRRCPDGRDESGLAGTAGASPCPHPSPGGRGASRL